jgi:hypothetical protein
MQPLHRCPPAPFMGVASRVAAGFSPRTGDPNLLTYSTTAALVKLREADHEQKSPGDRLRVLP